MAERRLRTLLRRSDANTRDFRFPLSATHGLLVEISSRRWPNKMLLPFGGFRRRLGTSIWLTATYCCMPQPGTLGIYLTTD